jgi:hypothetical protein
MDMGFLSSVKEKTRRSIIRSKIAIEVEIKKNVNGVRKETISVVWPCGRNERTRMLRRALG